MLILASNSQTRAEILRKNNIEFEQKESNFDEENITCKNANEFVYTATYGKMQNSINLYGLKKPILCADTILTCKDKILRKAKDKNHAKQMLELQSNSEVKILTCMIYQTKDFSFYDLSCSIYRFLKFDKEKLEIYLDGNDWQGKAGACMVEGFCKEFIQDFEGYESTAMGLCVEKLLPFLK